jgi:TolB protein
MLQYKVSRFRALMTAVALTAGCDRSGLMVSPSQRVGPELTASSAFPGFVTDPAPPTTDAGIGLAESGAPDVVYVSLPPGVSPNGLSATISNYRTNRSVSTPMVDGGFDPVRLGARAADTILVTFQLSGGATKLTWKVVPSAQRPVVVRMNPSSSRHDIPLESSMIVVFSEPIDPASLSTATIALMQRDYPVPGTAEVLPKEAWMARFTPSAQLASNATYELVVSDQIRDLDGDALGSVARARFTTRSTAQPVAGRLAFSSWSGSGATIYTMNADGSGLVTVTQGVDPSFSPDGTRIAFWRYESGSGAIYVADADGSNERRVVSDGYQPTWSSDGRRLAYGCGGICFVNVDGTGQTRLTPAAPKSQTPGICIRDSDPTWSPNGSTIAFTRWPDVAIPTSMCLSLGVAMSFPFDFWTEVWLVEADGSNLRPLKDGVGRTVTYAGWPTWSPDGRRLAFYYTNGSDERIAVASADTSGFVTIVQQKPPLWNSVLGSPDWSPDGSRVVFSTPGGWGFADASGWGQAELVKSPVGVTPNSLSWSWSRR